MKTTYTHLLFDLDGTLTDPMEGITRSVQYSLRHFGIEVTDLRSLTPFIGPPLAESFREFYGFDDGRIPEAIRLMREYFSERGWRENRLYDGMPQLLERLCASGLTLAVATSKPVVFARRILDHFDLARYFAFVGGAELDGSRQAKADVIAHVLQGLGGVDPATCLMIGDRRHDVAGAAAAGMDSCGVLWGYGSRAELTGAGATRIAADLGEVPVGAVVAKDGEIVARAHNLRESGKNATYHAELMAIDAACKALGGWRLWQCELFVTLEPCPMCSGAIINSRLKRVVYGARDPKAGCCGSLTDLFALPFNHHPVIESGLLEDEAQALLQDFFVMLREKRKKK